jgi:hypothetical protein
MMDSLQELKVLAGISNRPKWQEYKPGQTENISYTGTEKAQLMRKHDIKPGDQAWFRLFFAKPWLTGETPI